jgi:outer membrane biosynthesis protein TonB
MKSALRRHHQAIILALILLIHGGMLMMFIVAEFNTVPQEAIVMVEQDESPLSDREWVALNNSLPNAQLVAQEAAPQPEEQSEIFEKSDDSPMVEQTVAKQQTAEQKEQPHEMVAQEKEIDEAIELASHFLESKKPHEIQPEEELKKEPIPDQPTAITHISSSPTPAKQTPTLAELAQGFVKHLQQADMAVRSDHKGVASIDQIKHLNYCQKIIGCVVNSYKIHNHTAPKKALAHRARIYLALNRNGSIARLTLQESSGDVSIDRFLLDMFQDASSSFPPVPTALQENPYTLPTFSIDSLESFHSTQGWYVDNKSI